MQNFSHSCIQHVRVPSKPIARHQVPLLVNYSTRIFLIAVFTSIFHFLAQVLRVQIRDDVQLDESVSMHSGKSLPTQPPGAPLVSHSNLDSPTVTIATPGNRLSMPSNVRLSKQMVNFPATRANTKAGECLCRV